MVRRAALGPLFVCAFALAACHRADLQSSRPAELVAGRLDLSQIDLSQAGRLRLDGDWEFYHNEFIAPDAFRTPGAARKTTSYARLPGYWDDAHPELGTRGYATYRLRIRLSTTDANRRLGLYIPHAFTAYQMYVEGRPVAANGVPGRSADSTQEYFLPLAAVFQAGDAEVDIVIHVANFRTSKAGFRQSIELGDEPTILRYKQLRLAGDIFLVGGILSLALYHFGFFLLRRQEIYVLHFALFALALVFYKISTGEYFLAMILPELGWSVQMRILLISAFVSPLAYLGFLHELYREASPHRLTRALQFAFGGLAGAAWFLRGLWLEYALLAFQFLLPLFFFGVIYTLVRAIFLKLEGARAGLAGFAFLFIAAVNDVLFERDLVKSEIYVPGGLYALLMAHSFVLLRRFTRLFLMVEKQREKEARNAALRQRLYRTGLRARRIELEMMKHSIQPHFLINTLAAIRAWLLENPALAGRLLDDFSEEMRMIQSVAGRPKIPLSIELALCRRHLKVMEMRRENRYSLHTRGLNGEETIPPLIFHTMIENAFTHAAARHGDLRFYLWKRAGISADPARLVTRYRFIARGSDTAREERARKGAGTGLRYIKVRLQEAYPGGWSVQHGQAGLRYLFEIQIEEPIGAYTDR